MTALARSGVITAVGAGRAISPWGRALGRFRRDPIGLLLVTAVLLTALAAPLFTPYGPADQQRGAELAAPSQVHPLGTDEFGRDILSRVFYGGRASFFVGILAVACAAVVGTVLGLLSAYVGGWLEYVVMRLMDVML